MRHSHFSQPRRRPANRQEYLWRRGRWTSSLLFFSLLIGVSSGCSSSAVQEDRFISISDDGKSLGFQHGSSGIFVEQAGTLEQIYTPASDCVAVSSPKYSSDGKSLIFSVAKIRRNPNDKTESEAVMPVTFDSWDAAPQGRRFFAAPIRYTVMHYALDNGQAHSDTGASATGSLTELFSADVDHSGYVAGNLAISWFDNDQKILFVDRDTHSTVNLFEYDVASKRKSEPLIGSALSMVATISPDGQNAACLTSNADRKLELWVRFGGSQWLRCSSYVSQIADLDVDGLASIQAVRPVWSHDSKRFVLSSLRRQPNENFDKHELWQVTENADTSLVFESNTNIRHIHWHPSNDRLGMCSGGELICVSASSKEELWRYPDVRAFAGWSADQETIAFTRSVTPTVGKYCTIVQPQSASHDVLFAVAESGGKIEPKETNAILSGLRVTFPRWGNDDNQLLLWGTYTPPFRGVLSNLSAGLPPGDPAARLDLSKPAAERIHWLPTGAREMEQIGHYYLSLGDAETAWQWYSRADSAQPETTGTNAPASGMSLLLPSFVSADLHRAICLDRLGRSEESKEQRTVFEKAYRDWFSALPSLQQAQSNMPSGAPTDAPDSSAPAPDAGSAEEALETTVSELSVFWMTNYELEVYLSLNAKDELEPLLNKRISSQSGRAHLATLLARSQMFLLEEDDRQFDYAQWTMQHLVPLLPAACAELRDAATDLQSLAHFKTIMTIHGLALPMLPLMADEFYEDMTDEQLIGLESDYRKLVSELPGATPEFETELTAEVVYKAMEAIHGSMQDRGIDTANLPDAATRISPSARGEFEQLFRTVRSMLSEADWATPVANQTNHH